MLLLYGYFFFVYWVVLDVDGFNLIKGVIFGGGMGLVLFVYEMDVLVWGVCVDEIVKVFEFLFVIDGGVLFVLIVFVDNGYLCF